jgi:FlaA1/EpsC-like NDP-sugar epimerase
MIKNIFYKKNVLVTGGSGSIGSGIVQLLLKKKCKVIRVLSNDENGIYELSERLNGLNKKLSVKMKSNKIRYLLGDIRDFRRCLLATNKIDIVIHAAAMKHVPICEYNIDETYKTNVIGTKNLVDACLKNNVKRFLFISTDKAADPTSEMGKSKFEAEKIVIEANKKKITKFSVIRFGNILFSRGSVIFKFIKQINSKQKITITGENVSRFFVSLNLAVKCIANSIEIMKGREIFVVMKMPTFRIIDLAKAIKSIFKSKNPIKIIGLREGEKNYEKLISSKEILIKHPKVKKLGVIISNKIKIKNYNLETDSRFSNHLSIKNIKQILLKEKILKYKFI